MHYYSTSLSAEEQAISNAATQHFSALKGISPYASSASPELIVKYETGFPKGMTVTAPGFYAPQGRKVRLNNSIPDLLNLLGSFTYKNQRITNLEMETAGIYALASALGHRALSVNAILASRVKFEFSAQPQKIIESAIKAILERV